MNYGRLVILLLMAANIAGTACAQGLSQDDIYTEFRAANDLFRQANQASGTAEQAKELYARAILRYEKIVNEGGIKNARLYYNLANACLLKGDIGRAILNYRRAEKLDDSDTDIQKNLTFARSRRMDKVDLETGKRVLQTLFFWHYDFSIRGRLFLGSLFFGLLCIALAVLIWFGRRGNIVLAIVVCGVLTICFCTSVAVEALDRSRQVCGVVIAESVVARQGDGSNYLPSFEEPLHAGTEFDLIEKRPGWLHIRLADENKAWIADSSAELL